MPIQLLIGLGAGLIAAVVFASATTGPLLARVILFFLTPLPLFLAGLGWRWPAAAAGGLTATLVVALAAGLPAALLFAGSQVAPVVFLCYLASLNRTIAAAAPGSPTVEWYPVGRIVIWTALLAALLSLVSMLILGTNVEALRGSLRSFIEAVVHNQLPPGGGEQALGEEELNALTDMAAQLLPAGSAVTWMGALLLNLWLAGRVTLASGRLERPWPDLAAITYPPGTPLLLCAAILGTFLSGYLAVAATAVTGAFFLAYVLLGLAIIHFLTRGKSWRPFALWGLYAALLVLNTGLSLAIAILGLAESVLPLRARRLPPPGGPTI